MSTAKSVRLTTDLRNQISAAARKELFEEREANEAKIATVLAAKLMDWHIGAKNLALMKQLPPEYFNSRNNVRVRPEEAKYSEYESILSVDGLKAPAYLAYDSFVLPPTHGLWKEIRAVLARQEALNEDRQAFKTQLNAVLSSVSTVKKLLEIWPEAESWLPVEDAPKSLPAIRIDDINAMIAKLKAKK